MKHGVIKIEVMGDRASRFTPGRFAQHIVELSSNSIFIKDVRKPKDADILIYCRRVKDSLSEAVRYCKEQKVPLLFLSSGLDISNIDPKNFAFVVAPNSSPKVMRYIQEVVAAHDKYTGWPVVITEHHQPAKQDVSGTAKAIARKIGVNENEIISVRDWEATKEKYGLTGISGDGYAVHSVVFTNPDDPSVTKSVDIVVQGRSSYAQGAVDLARSIVNDSGEYKPGILELH